MFVEKCCLNAVKKIKKKSNLRSHNYILDNCRYHWSCIGRVSVLREEWKVKMEHKSIILKSECICPCIWSLRWVERARGSLSLVGIVLGESWMPQVWETKAFLLPITLRGFINNGLFKVAIVLTPLAYTIKETRKEHTQIHFYMTSLFCRHASENVVHGMPWSDSMLQVNHILGSGSIFVCLFHVLPWHGPSLCMSFTLSVWLLSACLHLFLSLLSQSFPLFLPSLYHSLSLLSLAFSLFPPEQPCWILIAPSSGSD